MTQSSTGARSGETVDRQGIAEQNLLVIAKQTATLFGRKARLGCQFPIGENRHGIFLLEVFDGEVF